MIEPVVDIRVLCPSAEQACEAGLLYVFLPKLRIVEVAAPVDCLLCLSPRDGYPSRLFFAEQLSVPGKQLNWNASVHILGRNWYAYSWKDVRTDQSASKVLLAHLDALR